MRNRTALFESLLRSSCIKLVVTVSLLSFGFVFASSYAAEKRFGSWLVGPITDNEGVYAATANDSGAILGQYCYNSEASCFWLLANDTNCEPGSRYPVLVNADTGAYSLEMLCIKLEGKGRYAFTDFDAIDGLIKKSSRIGIAFPLKSGLFQVTRFSLNGSSNAVTFMRSIAEAVIKKTGGTKDTLL